MTSLHERQASLTLTGSTGLDDATIARLVAEAADAASGNALQANVRITSTEPGVILVGVFRASILGTQDVYAAVNVTRNGSGAAAIQVVVTNHRYGRNTIYMIPAGPKYMCSNSGYVRFLTQLQTKLTQADPAADLSQRRLVS